MRIRVFLLAVASVIASGASAQSSTQKAPSAIGAWRGTSTCLVRQSACHDEVVVYRIAQGNGSDSVNIDGRRIAGGQEVEMGILPCRFTRASGSIACTIPQGTWRFQIHGDSLVGELIHPDNTKFRDVRATRSR